MKSQLQYINLRDELEGGESFAQVDYFGKNIGCIVERPKSVFFAAGWYAYNRTGKQLNEAPKQTKEEVIIYLIATF